MGRDVRTPIGALGRRAFLVGAGAGVGWLATRGLGALAPSGSPAAAPRDAGALLRALVASMRPDQRALALFPADHPSREVANTVSFLARPHVGELFDAQQRACIDALVDASLSARGRTDMAATLALEGRVGASVLAIYGDPLEGRAQAVVAGGHYTLRAGDDGRGGALAYGQQVGNGRHRVAGNAFARHGDAANRLMAALGAPSRARAIRADAPDEFLLQPLGEGEVFPGVARASLDGAAADAFDALVAEVLGTFAPDAGRRVDTASLAFSVFARHGYWPDRVAFADAAPRERTARGEPYWQVWRVEGPGVVIHFQGFPHVHAYVQATDPAFAAVGERVARLDAPLAGDAMRAAREAAMRRATGEALAFQRAESLGRLAAGDVTTGQLYTLEPFGNRIVVATIDGRAMASPLRERLAAASAGAIDPARSYRVATDEYAVSLADGFGVPSRVDVHGVEVREALVAHARAGGLA
ncbi:MAG: 5'-nucleotidase C-terminal domain-containing protein [Myxococcota bacterium]